MAAHKRALEDTSSTQKLKKSKISKNEAGKNLQSATTTEEVDFPRGGGTSFTPLEVKTIRAEAVKEANEELFHVEPKNTKKRKRKSEVHTSGGSAAAETGDRIRIEHLNYKRINIGMKILGQIVSIQPLALIVSLPNQLFAHVPITNISSQLTELLEQEGEESEEEEEEGQPRKSRVPTLFEIFQEGQYIRAVVSAVHAHGSTDITGIVKSRDEVVKASRRVELSLVPERVNSGVQKSDLSADFATVKSVEDHGYILELGVPKVSGFLSFADAKLGSGDSRLFVGQLLEITVTKVSSNGRICNVTADVKKFCSSSLSEVTNVTSILPGALVQSLVTAVSPHGLNLQVLGFFDGTVDQLHLTRPPSEYKVGKKVKGRVLYDFSSTPPRFALALADHVIALRSRRIKALNESEDQTLQAIYPVGKIVEEAKVVRLEAERGILVEIEPGFEGFVHISHVSDDHVPSLSSSGPWKIGSVHRARVTGYFLFDGLLQLSLKPSVLEQKFLKVGDVEVGEVVKGTIKKLTEAGLFVSMSGNIDGVVWPNHYADISLKQPAKRFKPGANIRCRVLVVDTDRNRISLTAKKTLVDSTLPILSEFEEVKVGIVTYAVVFRIHEKHLMVEFYNNLKASVPAKEIIETPSDKLADLFPVGKVVKVRILAVDTEHRRIVASIRQAAPNAKLTVTDIGGVEIGNIVNGTVSEVHKDNLVLELKPTGARALMSLKNLANHRGVSMAQLRTSLQAGDALSELVVVTRNPDKGYVIVANAPKVKGALQSKSSITIDSVAPGQIVGGRVIRHTRHGALVKITAHITGTLHPTDASDDYEAGHPFPAIDSVLKAAIIEVDQAKKQLVLSTRRSKMYPEEVKPITDREIRDLHDLVAGETVRGFIKSVAEHGLFVTLGRNIDARVQIRELFDDYVKDWKARFTTNQIVKGRILSVNPETKQVEMSFRTGVLKPSEALSAGDLQIGQKIDGVVKRIENYGLFIQIDGSKLSGLCHKSQLTDNTDADVALALRGFREGDHVKAAILNIEKKKISFSLKPSLFTEEDFDVHDDEATSPASESEALGVIDDTLEMSEHGVEEDDVVKVDSESDDDDVMQVDLSSHGQFHGPSRSQDATTATPAIPSTIPSLTLSGGFHWSGNEPEQDQSVGSAPSEDDESDTEGQPSKKKKRRRKEIEHDLTADMQTKTPESNADFERVLLGSPNSSYLWIQYMSFQLQLSEVGKAREIARRAIRTINFREEQERLNVWIALLNLENVYGTDETIETVFKEASRANDSKTVYLRLASIFSQTDKHEKAEEQYKRTAKKFGQSSKVWTLFGEYFLRRGDLEEARKLIPRSLQSLDKRKHLKTISRFAQLEYKSGEPERGKTIFEGIVDSHPKRWDLWSIYMDMEAGQRDIQSLRNLFDRVLALKMTSHKAKFFFKKWLELERKIGDEDGASIVKQKAVEWTQRANTS
ncbi:hypothetical protein L208DRAFT_1324246 [Tricholoma matsutake]|nr:hypothetical protein L208DRAFT_1324246 [Tricholoma matsutake 945]